MAETPTTTVDHQPLLDAVELRLTELFDDEASQWAHVDDTISSGLDSLREFVLGGGKRIRPQFVNLGYRAAAETSIDLRGDGIQPSQLVDLAAAVELLHAFALIHDDVMDGSETRRHRATVHASYRDQHPVHGWRGEARRTGEGMAILLGDLAFAYSVRLEQSFSEAVRAILNETRIELHMGQYLDMMAAAEGTSDQSRLVAITEHKTARYTVIRPLQLGAAVAGCSKLHPMFAEYGQNVGIAFQLRDDVLGVFGNPKVTGKPTFDDLMTGKETLLLKETLRTPGATNHPALAQLGTDNFTFEDAEAVADLMINCGAVAKVEEEIDRRLAAAIATVEQAPVKPAVARSMTAMAEQATRRAQ